MPSSDLPRSSGVPKPRLFRHTAATEQRPTPPGGAENGGRKARRRIQGNEEFTCFCEVDRTCHCVTLSEKKKKANYYNDCIYIYILIIVNQYIIYIY